MMTARLPSWTDCVVEVVDIGRHSFWGKIVDKKHNVTVSPCQSFSLNEPWMFSEKLAVCLSVSSSADLVLSTTN